MKIINHLDFTWTDMDISVSRIYWKSGDTEIMFLEERSWMRSDPVCIKETPHHLGFIPNMMRLAA
jgi:hypothetical protein